MKHNSLLLLIILIFSFFSIKTAAPLEVSVENDCAISSNTFLPETDSEEFSLDPRFELPNLFLKTHKALTEVADTNRLETLREAWNGLPFGDINADSFSKSVNDNFKRVEKHITDPHLAYLALGFCSLDHMSPDTSLRNFNEIIAPRTTLKKATELEDPKIKLAAQHCKKTMKQLYYSDFINQKSLEKEETALAIESFDPENLNPETIASFLTATEPLAQVVRQAGYLTTPASNQFLKAYCKGPETLKEEIESYLEAIKKHQLTPTIAGEVSMALSSKKNNYGLEEETRAVDELKQLIDRMPTVQQSAWPLSLQAASQAVSALYYGSPKN